MLFQEAMQKGYVVLQTVVLLLIGIAGAGKTSFCHLLFNEPPPKVRKSTPIAQSSIRAVSLTRATVLMKEEVVSWERISLKKLNSLIADGIKSLQAHGFQQQISFLVEAELMMQHTILLSVKQSPQKTHDALPSIKQPSHDAQSSTDESEVDSSAPSNSTDEESEEELLSSLDVDQHFEIEQVEDVDQLFEMEQVKELLRLITHAKGSGEIFKHKWLYLIDSGGCMYVWANSFSTVLSNEKCIFSMISNSQ